jgi:hypothetical protein
MGESGLKIYPRDWYLEYLGSLATQGQGTKAPKASETMIVLDNRPGPDMAHMLVL